MLCELFVYCVFRQKQTDISDRTLQNQTESPLLRLPPEIRNAIYESVFGNLHLIIQENQRTVAVFHQTPSNGISPTSFTLTELLRVTTVCRQIRTETALLPLEYSEIFVGNISDESMTREFLSKLTPQQQDAISDVRFAVNMGPLVLVISHLLDSGLLELKGLRRATIRILRMYGWVRREMQLMQEHIRAIFKSCSVSRPEFVFEIE